MTVKRTRATRLHETRAQLGEGPVWDARTGVLWLVDVVSQTVHRLEPNTGRLSSWVAPATIGWVAPATGGNLLAGLAKGLYRFSPASGQFTLLHPVEPHRPETRINDGVVDPFGKVWFGTMEQNGQFPCGRFYRFDGRSIEDTGIAPMRITNGPAVAPDGRTLYAVDTLGGQVSAYPLDRNGLLGEPRPLIEVDRSEGLPDGVTCDAAGGIWVALWGGWTARRYDATGALTAVVRLPVANVTKVALGGADGRTAYVTTAREGLDDDELARQPQAGDIFTFRVETPGVPAPEVDIG